MTRMTPYSYTLLRYVHDVLTGEFVNVGVVLYAPATQTVRFKTRTTIGRLRRVFPDVDRAAFVASMYAARRALQRVAKAEAEIDMFRHRTNASERADAVSIAARAIPKDDSSLQWSTAGTGIAEDTEEALDRLFARFVSKYDEPARTRMSDEDVWRPVRQKLEERNLGVQLQEKSIHGGLDDIVFKHAWKNGQWHVYEPLSFDLADADGIKSKARETLGHLLAVVADGRAEHFKPHFIVGAPRTPALEDAFRTAIGILEKAPNNPEVFEENQLDSLVDQIEDEVRAHRSSEARQ